jgi:diguanylate cyclase (GGDEF)-like protein
MDEAQQLLLWRWSTIVQLTSLAMATAFFALLAHASRRRELRSWTRAWLANFLALLVTAAYWTLQPESLFPVVSSLYLAGKAVFVLLLIEGAWIMMRPHERLFQPRQAAIGVAVYAVLGAALCRDLQSIGILQHSVLGITLAGLAVMLWREKCDGLRWLVGAVALRGLLSLVEAGAYLVQASPVESDLGIWLNGVAATFLPASSSFDTAVEWLLVLGCLLAVSERSRRELQDANRDLLTAQEDLRRLADRDPLTALVNRRSLPEIFRAVQPHGAVLLFFDLDDFKKVNDLRGHAAGDACLKLFANALRDSFRPDDHVIRYGGDEFLVVANGLDTGAARARVDEVRKRMQRAGGGELACRFSVGMAELAPGGQPEAALELADAQMYKAKHEAMA